MRLPPPPTVTIIIRSRTPQKGLESRTEAMNPCIILFFFFGVGLELERTLASQNFRFTWWLQCQLTSWRFNQYWNGVRKKFIQTNFLDFYDKGEGNGVLSPLSSQFRPPVWLLLLSTARGEVSEVPSPLRVAISGQGTLSQSLNERVERNHDSALQMIQQLCY